jgi:hypothetical protein
MMLWTVFNAIAMLICLGSAGFQWAVYHRVWNQAEQNSRQIASVRSKQSYDEGKVSDMIDERLDRLQASQQQSDQSGGSGFDMQTLMMLQGMMQGQQQAAPQPPQQAPQQAESNGQLDTEAEDPDIEGQFMHQFAEQQD